VNDASIPPKREGVCAACGCTFPGPKRGPIPALCPQCRLTIPGSEQQAIAQAFNARRWPDGTDARKTSAQTAAAAHWYQHERKPPPATPMVKCPYCPDLMPAWRKQCGKPECHKKFQRDRCREWQRQYSDEHGIGYAMALNPEKRRESRRNCKARRRGLPGTYTTADEKAQYKRQHGKCFWRQVNPACAVSLKGGYHVDHVIPVAGERTSSNGPENIVLSCPQCNTSKHAKDPMDWAGVMF